MEHNKRVLLIVETSRSFGRQVVQGVSQYVQENRTWSFFFANRSVVENYPKWFDEWDGDGIISRSDNTKLCRRLARKNLPFVELEGDGSHYLAHVRVDEQWNCTLAVDHFWNKGFRNFAFFSMGHNWWSLTRCRNFTEELSRRGIVCDIAPQTRREIGDVSLPLIWWKGCESQIAQWLRSLPKPAAVFCPWDMHALFLMSVCKTFGIIVPEEVAVLGYGNNADLCQWSIPPLSSLSPNARQIGYEAAALLERMMSGQQIPTLPIMVRASHIAMRQSTELLAVGNPDVSRAIGFIRENISRNPGVENVADMLGISKSTLNRLFRKTVRRSPKEEIAAARMEWAKELLRETDFSVESVARQLRFSSPANFIRAFRAHCGITPVEYRKKNRI